MPVDGALNAPGLIAVVTNTRSRQTMGDDQPRPGRSTAQATLSAVDQRSGSVDSSATPAPPGPAKLRPLVRACSLNHAVRPEAREAGDEEQGEVTHGATRYHPRWRSAMDG